LSLHSCHGTENYWSERLCATRWLAYSLWCCWQHLRSKSLLSCRDYSGTRCCVYSSFSVSVLL